MFLKAFIPRYHLREGSAGLEPSTLPSASYPSSNSGASNTSGSNSQSKPFYVYEIEVSFCGKFNRICRRYSQFLSLHHELRKRYRTPEFPPKRLLKTSPKVLEQRRCGLEAYIQYFVRMTQVPAPLLKFLEVPSEEVNAFDWGEKPTHQPVAGFLKDPFLSPPSGDRLPDIVGQATLDFFYGEKVALP